MKQRLGPQLYAEVIRLRCEDESNMLYALAGKRSNCKCGYHENPVPLAPLFEAEANASEERRIIEAVAEMPMVSRAEGDECPFHCGYVYNSWHELPHAASCPIVIAKTLTS